MAVSEHRVAFGGNGGRVVWRENNLDPRALAWHASRDMSCRARKDGISTSIEPGAVRLSEITAFCRLAPRLLHEPRRTSGTVGGAHERLTPFIRLENCSKESVLQPQSPTIDVNCSSAPSTARTFLGDLHTPRGPSAGWSRHHCLSLDGSMAGMLGTIRAAGSALPARR